MKTFQLTCCSGLFSLLELRQTHPRFVFSKCSGHLKNLRKTEVLLFEFYFLLVHFFQELDVDFFFTIVLF